MAKETSGKFGVGLTASILHSSLIFSSCDESGDAAQDLGGFFVDGGVCQITTRVQRDPTQAAAAEFEPTEAASSSSSSSSSSDSDISSDLGIMRCVFGVDRALGRIVCLRRERYTDGGELCVGDGRSDVESASPLAGFKGTEVRLVVPGGTAVGLGGLRLVRYFQRLHLSVHLLNCSVEYVMHLPLLSSGLLPVITQCEVIAMVP